MENTFKMASGDVVELSGDPNQSASRGGALLGRGGQGEVFKAKSRKTGEILALKLYSHEMPQALIENLVRIAGRAPHPAFLWPLDVTERLPNAKFGYTMKLYGSEYVSLHEILKGTKQFPSKEMQIAALIDLMDAFEALHARGYNYGCIDGTTVLFDCDNGKVLICNNDTVAPYGVDFGLIGELRWSAPEVVIQMFRPDKYSERFSLAVLMFYLLLHAHPYDGAMRLRGERTGSLEYQIYGTEPVFIFHPTDTGNRPDPVADKKVIEGWACLPEYIRELFTRTFTSGMPGPDKSRDALRRERMERVGEREWKAALRRWADTLKG